MSMGADPYNARKLSDIGVTGAYMNPIMGGVLSASDLPGHLLKGEFSKAAWDTIGMVPGALNIKRMVKGVPQVPMADTHGVSTINPTYRRESRHFRSWTGTNTRARGQGRSGPTTSWAQRGRPPTAAPVPVRCSTIPTH